jgi:hypothetical protein
MAERRRSLTLQVETGDPTLAKIYWSAIEVLEDGILKEKLQTWNVTAAPAANWHRPTNKYA